MMRLQNLQELEQFELRWKTTLVVSAIVLACAVLDIFLRAPQGWEAFWCYVVGAGALGLCILAASRLRASKWGDETIDAVDALDSVGGDD